MKSPSREYLVAGVVCWRSGEDQREVKSQLSKTDPELQIRCHTTISATYDLCRKYVGCLDDLTRAAKELIDGTWTLKRTFQGPSAHLDPPALIGIWFPRWLWMLWLKLWHRISCATKKSAECLDLESAANSQCRYSLLQYKSMHHNIVATGSWSKDGSGWRKLCKFDSIWSWCPSGCNRFWRTLRFVWGFCGTLKLKVGATLAQLGCGGLPNDKKPKRQASAATLEFINVHQSLEARADIWTWIYQRFRKVPHPGSSHWIQASQFVPVHSTTRYDTSASCSNLQATYRSCARASNSKWDDSMIEGNGIAQGNKALNYIELHLWMFFFPHRLSSWIQGQSVPPGSPGPRLISSHSAPSVRSDAQTSKVWSPMSKSRKFRWIIINIPHAMKGCVIVARVNFLGGPAPCCNCLRVHTSSSSPWDQNQESSRPSSLSKTQLYWSFCSALANLITRTSARAMHEIAGLKVSTYLSLGVGSASHC